MEITDFSPLFEEIEKLDSKSLIVFDIDETLIVAKDKILRPCGEKHVSSLEAQHGGGLTEEQKRELRSITLLQREILFTDPQLPQLFRKIKERGIPCIALTAMLTGKYGIIPSFEEWRGEELKRYGIDFTLYSPFTQTLHFHELGHEAPPMFYRGILMSSMYPKGMALKAFFDKAEFLPEKVVFVDDLHHNLVSVENELTELKIPYLGFHYTAIKKLQEEVNVDVAKMQFYYLLKNKKWLSDEQARDLIQAKNK